MRCLHCRARVEPGRAERGIESCAACGDAAAAADIASKRSQVAPAYNKGALMFVGGANFRQNALDAGRKTSADGSCPDVSDAAPRRKRGPVPARRIVGTMWDAEGRATALREGDDPVRKGAARWARYR